MYQLPADTGFFFFSEVPQSPFPSPYLLILQTRERQKKGHKKNFLLIEKSKEKRNEKRTCFFLRTSKNGLKWAFERNEEEENEKEKETVEPGASTESKQSKVYISYSIAHIKDRLCEDICPATAGRFPFPIKRKMLIFRIGHKMRI